ncbi:hypothetical protein BESB_069280 [Besnoitia besnoiti]|uniref:Methyltransferase domain-containing protein n=1 Tax=Besnoitia besnoiti TaxID=94643 RepID=A0A2A9MA77_BESBE|nr:hypothetical protein BESB_069280 [Besnoitia besnoiti]PFH34895.1 hypothetical protein BESB_069280 [Besnoitia besnoiti]
MTVETPAASDPSAGSAASGCASTPSPSSSPGDTFAFPMSSLSAVEQWEEDQLKEKASKLVSPFSPASEAQIRAALAFGGVSASDVLLDVGCGDGRVCRAAVRSFSVSRALGVDINPFLVQEAEELAREEFPACFSSQDARFQFLEMCVPFDEDSSGTGAQPTDSGEESAAEGPEASAPAAASALCMSELPSQYHPLFELIRANGVTVIFLYLVPRHTARMSNFFRFLLRMPGLKIISLRFAVPEGTRLVGQKAADEKFFVPRGDEPELLYKVHVYSRAAGPARS